MGVGEKAFNISQKWRSIVRGNGGAFPFYPKFAWHWLLYQTSKEHLTLDIYAKRIIQPSHFLDCRMTYNVDNWAWCTMRRKQKGLKNHRRHTWHWLEVQDEADAHCCRYILHKVIHIHMQTYTLAKFSWCICTFLPFHMSLCI